MYVSGAVVVRCAGGRRSGLFFSGGSGGWFRIFVQRRTLGFHPVGAGAILLGSHLHFAAAHPKAARAVLLSLAVPGGCAVAFFLLVMITHPRWN
jgi:hypothetical protein